MLLLSLVLSCDALTEQVMFIEYPYSSECVGMKIEELFWPNEADFPCQGNEIWMVLYMTLKVDY